MSLPWERHPVVIQMRKKFKAKVIAVKQETNLMTGTPGTEINPKMLPPMVDFRKALARKRKI